MARAYSVNVQNATLTANILNALHRIVSGTTYRLMVYDLIIGSRATADNAAAFRLTRETGFTSGGAAVTPNPIDTGNPAAVATASSGATGTAYVGLTGTVSVLTFGMNQRATYRYICSPGREFVFAAAANAGALLICDAVSAAYAVDLTTYFEE